MNIYVVKMHDTERNFAAICMQNDGKYNIHNVFY